MSPERSLALGLVVVLVILLVAAFVWYNFTGWAGFTFAGTVPYGIGPPCNANPPPGSTTCPAGAACCPAGQQCGGAQCLTPCASSADCAAGQNCAGGACQSGLLPSWSVTNSARNISDLRFKGCVFTVTDPQGQQHAADVTAVLNGMAVAFRGATAAVPQTLYLDRPLNAFSFRIPGVNDSATVTSAAAAAAWANSATTLTGQFRTI